MDLDNFFHPRSIAVIGASTNPKKIGYQIFKKLLSSSVKVYPVNPNRKQILARPCYPDIKTIPGPVDQAVIVLPANLVLEVAKTAIAKKVKSIVVVSAGFSESGPKGKAKELILKKLCQQANVGLLGPNCFGYSSADKTIDLTFAKTPPPKGNIALISQSGAIGSFLFDWAKKENLGFSKFVSLGNRAGINENDLLNYLKTDQTTKVIALYLESFSSGLDFLIQASRLSKKKPTIVIFGGTTASGHQAALSHTAALSPQAEVIHTALIQSGCLEVRGLEEFTDLLEVFSLEPSLVDNDLAIVTNAGGPGILATDTASQLKLDVTHPVDVLGDALADQFKSAFNQVIKDQVKDAFLIILTPQTVTQIELTCQAIVDQFKSVKKPLIVSLLGGKINDRAKKILAANKIATIDFPQNAVNSLSRLYEYCRQQKLLLPYPIRQTKIVSGHLKKLARIASKLPFGNLSWKQIKTLANLYHLPLVETLPVTMENLPSIIHRLGFPLVLKSDPAESRRRTEKNALYLNLNSSSKISAAFQRLKSQFKVVLAQPQIQTGHELFIGIAKQTGFPPLITLGSGGIYTEIYRDVTRSFLPLNQKTALKLLQQTKLGQILSGQRNLPPINLTAAINLILSVAQLAADVPEISEINLNPAIITSNSIHIVDIKITTQPTRTLLEG